jgi:hypothetical protein
MRGDVRRSCNTDNRMMKAAHDVENRFRRLSEQWKDQSQHLSNTAQMALLKPYQRIIGMGLPVVPLILQELEREPDQWFWALEAITEENPVPQESAGNVRLMAQAWIEWGKRHRFDHRTIDPTGECLNEMLRFWNL